MRRKFVVAIFIVAVGPAAVRHAALSLAEQPAAADQSALAAQYRSEAAAMRAKATEHDGMAGRYQELGPPLSSLEHGEVGMRRPIVLPVAGFILLLGQVPLGRTDSVVLESKDGRSRLELPPGWERLEVVGVQIAATNPTKRLYAEVITEDRRDFDGDLQKYAARRRETFAKILGNVSWAPGRSLTVNGNPAWRYEGRGTRGGIKAAFLLTIVQIGNDYHTVWVWCGQSHFEDDRAELEEIPLGLRSRRPAQRTKRLRTDAGPAYAA